MSSGKCEKRPVQFYLVENAKGCSTHSLKLRLIKEGLLLNKCYECGSLPFWNNKKLSLQLDHINGIRNDNRLENLQILCPNCHSQTKTYSGKKHKEYHFCEKCGNKRTKSAKLCRMCANIESAKNNPLLQIKKSWPTKEELEKLIWTKPLSDLCKDFNASFNGLKKHCQKIGIILPPKSYWIRIKNGYSHELALNPPIKIRKYKKLFTLKQIEEIKKLLSTTDLSYRDIGKMFNVHHRSISNIDKGIGYISSKTLKTIDNYEKEKLVAKV